MHNEKFQDMDDAKGLDEVACDPPISPPPAINQPSVVNSPIELGPRG